MATLLNQRHPSFQIYIPDTGAWRKFVDGRLDIEPDDPDYETVMAEAKRNPTIAIYDSVTTCPHCGEPFRTKGELSDHVKEVHFEVWLAGFDADHAEQRNIELKRRASVFCDICVPHQEFPDNDALAAHNKLLHLALENEQEVQGSTAPAPKAKRQPPVQAEGPTKKELLARAAELGIVDALPKRATNAVIAAAIAEAEAAAKTES